MKPLVLCAAVFRSRVLPLVGLLLACLALLGPASAGAENRFTLETQPVSKGHLLVDNAGNAYIGWTSRGFGTAPEPVHFCKVPQGGSCTSPITLPIPGAASLSDSVSAAIPVFGPGETVYVVGPRYAHNDLIFWTSTNGGASFDGGTNRDFYLKTNPTEAFFDGSSFLIGSFNSGLGFSVDETGGLGGGELDFANPGSVAGSSMGLDAGGNPVIVYWNLEAPPYPLFYYRYKGAGSRTVEANWEGPIPIAKGYESVLAGGPAGLFMASEDYSGGQYPDTINVRRFEGTGFGAPHTLVRDSETSLFIGGAIAQSSSGNRLAVAWPGKRAGDGSYVMRLWTSTDGGGSYAESHVAHIAGSYAIGRNADLAINDGGAGWIVFTDSSGLQVADLTPIAPFVDNQRPSRPPNYKGKTKVADSKKVGNYNLILRLPKQCVQSRQRFFAGVGARKRKALSKKLGGRIRLTKVVFIYDGKKLKVKKKRPFRYLIDPGPMQPGSTHVVKAKVTVILTKKGKSRKVKRTLKGKITAC